MKFYLDRVNAFFFLMFLLMCTFYKRWLILGGVHNVE